MILSTNLPSEKQFRRALFPSSQVSLNHNSDWEPKENTRSVTSRILREEQSSVGKEIYQYTMSLQPYDVPGAVCVLAL